MIEKPQRQLVVLQVSFLTGSFYLKYSALARIFLKDLVLSPAHLNM